MSEETIRCGYRVTFSDPYGYAFMRDEPRKVRIKFDDGYTIIMDQPLYDDVDDQTFTAYVEHVHQTGIRERDYHRDLTTWKCGRLESLRRGLSLRRRWHWECHICHLTDTDGHRAWNGADHDARAHHDERHAPAAGD